MDINFELYKIFYHAARCGSFSDAARQLYITQSAVSQAISSLEEKIGSRLFVRKTRNIRLTVEGEVLFRHIEQAYHFIKTGETRVHEIQNLELGEIRIGAGDTVCRYFLVPILQKFIRMYPQIKIRVINRTSPHIIEILKNGRIDLGIVTLPFTGENISVRHFRQAEDVFVASERFQELRGKSISLEELIRHPLLLLPKSSATRRNLDEALKQKGLELAPEIELESMELLVEFARIGLGISHVLKESASGLIERGDLFTVSLSENLPPRQLGVATAANVPLSKATTAFLDLLAT